MKLEHQVVSLNLSKQLKEVGYEQEGIWMWWTPFGEPKIVNHTKFTKKNKGIIAPTVAELGERLPLMFYDKDNKDWRYEQLKREDDKREPKWICGYRRWTQAVYKEAKSEADARAKIWLYLKKKRGGLL